MKRLLCSILLAIGLCSGLRAQVIILNDSMFKGRMSEIKATVLDSLTNEPVGFASVYLIPSKDTTITNFTLTDANGEATLDEVPFGSYVFHVEMMGYKPFVKERYFREREEDMGTIRLQVDEYFLQAATVTDVGNPIVIKKDTVEFNASSFRVGANAMLKDLLQRMPGMEVTDDGKVKFNGEAIDKLTVGGRTFFFNDQSTALNNLPASVVDKIRVIDRDSEATRATGVQDGSKEKVLDVALKKEYEKGWFGNVGLKGGTTLGLNTDEPLRDDRGFLFSGNALLSAYTEKDQVTVIANGQNINDSGAIIIVQDENGERTSLNQGLSTAWQLGVNANTSRIKDVETTVGANWKYSDTDSGTRSARTTWQDDGTLFSTRDNTGKQYANSLGANMEFQKETGKVWFYVRPDFSYTRSESYQSGKSETLREGLAINHAENSTQSLGTTKTASFDSGFTFRDLWGKEGRSLRIELVGEYSGTGGESEEQSHLTVAGITDVRALNYVSDGTAYAAATSLTYTEPLGKKWTLSSTASLDYAHSGKIREAFDTQGLNDYYSSESRNKSLNQRYGLSAQFQIREKTYVTLGARLNGILNETFSKSFGIAATTGQDEWNWFVLPYLRFQTATEQGRFTFNVSGDSQKPVASRMLPVLNISDPSRLSVGNIYLKPYGDTYFFLSWDWSNRKRFTSLMAWMNGDIIRNPVSFARWYDASGILYSLPVNARKPTVNSTLNIMYTTPLDKKKNWSMTLGAAATLSSATSYQPQGTLSALDKDSFDYSAFMAAFWGDASGDLFYGGKSGFRESSTLSFSPTGALTLKYNQDRYSFSVDATTTGRIVRYSLDPSIDMNTLETRFRGRGSYITRHEYTFDTDISYVFYRGYPEGYGDPEWRWNASVSKNIGAFNLSLTVHDILNQTRNLTHTVTANYSEDTYRLVMGRYLLFGVKWNFGKMNAAHSQRAQNAMWEMVW